MSISESDVASMVVKEYKCDIGVIYFFNHIGVVEFNGGLHIDLEAFRESLNAIVKYFGPTQSYGLVANRVNSYSISLLDLSEVRQSLPNMAAYGIITHNEAGKMNAIIETNFCETPNICFENLYEGLDSVYNKVKDKMRISLN